MAQTKIDQSMIEGLNTRLASIEANASKQVMIVEDVKSNGTDGGSNSGGSYVQRTLNTVRHNTITGASLASNQITLPAGTYEVTARCPAHYYVYEHRARLVDTSGNELVLGQNAHAGWSSGSSSANTICTTTSVVSGVFTLTSETAVRLEHYTTSTYNTVGFGSALADGKDEVYSTMRIEKIG